MRSLKDSLLAKLSSVLILIILEVTLWVRNVDADGVITFEVLILIILEVTLWAAVQKADEADADRS